MPYDGYGGDEGFSHDGKQGRCSYYLDKKLRIQRNSPKINDSGLEIIGRMENRNKLV